jgi:hypothetical protein
MDGQNDDCKTKGGSEASHINRFKEDALTHPVMVNLSLLLVLLIRNVKKLLVKFLSCTLIFD